VWGTPSCGAAHWRPWREATDTSRVAGVDVIHRHRRPQAANRPCGAWIRRRNSEEGANGATGEIDAAPLTKTTLSNWISELFLKPDENSALKLLNEMILACGKCFWSWNLVRWCIDASRGSLNFLRIFGRNKIWISLKTANWVQTSSGQILKFLNCGSGYFWRYWLRVLRTIWDNFTGVISQRKRALPL